MLPFSVSTASSNTSPSRRGEPSYPYRAEARSRSPVAQLQRKPSRILLLERPLQLFPARTKPLTASPLRFLNTRRTCNEKRMRQAVKGRLPSLPLRQIRAVGIYTLHPLPQEIWATRYLMQRETASCREILPTVHQRE